MEEEEKTKMTLYERLGHVLNEWMWCDICVCVFVSLSEWEMKWITNETDNTDDELN